MWSEAESAEEGAVLALKQPPLRYSRLMLVVSATGRTPKRRGMESSIILLKHKL